MLLLLSSCGSKKIDGAVVFPHNGLADANKMGSPCTAPGRFANVVTAGTAIRIKNGKGEIIGMAKLSEGKQIQEELTEEDKRLLQDPAVARQFAGKTLVGCEFPFQVNLKPSDVYQVSLDGVQENMIYSNEELEKKQQLIFTIK